MAVRFARRITIAKGVRLNVSKSGLGLSIGPRGASLSIGPTGAYVHSGIPGTGLSIRTKLDTSAYGTVQTSDDSFSLNVSIEKETGKETITVKDAQGYTVTDESAMRKVKRTEIFKEILADARHKAYDEIMEAVESLTDIYKKSEKIISLAEVETELQELKPETYSVKEYHIKAPEKEFYQRDLEAQARREISSILFWKNKKLRETFVNDNIEKVFQDAVDKWNDDKNKHDLSEKAREKEENAKYRAKFEAQKATIEKIIQCDNEYVTETLESILSEIQLPLDFSVDFQVDGTIINLDVDLPEIEDFPTVKAEMLSSGKLSVKSKSQSEINKDYATCVTGLAFYFASIIFNISPTITNIRIAGYTQRVNNKTGNTENQYVYSVDFDREKFAELNIEKIDPTQALDNFDNQKNITSKYEMKTIAVK